MNLNINWKLKKIHEFNATYFFNYFLDLKNALEIQSYKGMLAWTKIDINSFIRLYIKSHANNKMSNIKRIYFYYSW
jgi:hypothetical protein